MAFAAMKHDNDPADELKAALGDISEFELFQNQVLVAVYQRPEKTKTGIILAHQTRDEDRYQSKVGLVVAKGPQAFVDGKDWKFETPLGLGEWAVFRPSDGWGVTVNGVLCRVLVDTSIKGRVANPDFVW